MRRSFFGAALAAAMLIPSAALAIPIVISGTGGTGASFSGTFDYDASTTTVTVSLTNTSPLAVGGFLTGFVFNIPSSADVTGVVHTPPALNPLFLLLGSPTFDDNVNGAPNGNFDIGSALGGNYEGGGNPAGGLAPGSSGIWTFALTGTGLGGLTSQSFLSTLSVPPGAGEGVEDFVVRFRGLSTEPDSDKVPNSEPPFVIPEPGTAMLVGLGLASLAARRRARARKQPL